MKKEKIWKHREVLKVWALGTIVGPTSAKTTKSAKFFIKRKTAKNCPIYRTWRLPLIYLFYYQLPFFKNGKIHPLN